MSPFYLKLLSIIPFVQKSSQVDWFWKKSKGRIIYIKNKKFSSSKTKKQKNKQYHGFIWYKIWLFVSVGLFGVLYVFRQNYKELQMFKGSIFKLEVYSK